MEHCIFYMIKNIIEYIKLLQIITNYFKIERFFKMKIKWNLLISLKVENTKLRICTGKSKKISLFPFLNSILDFLKLQGSWKAW